MKPSKLIYALTLILNPLIFVSMGADYEQGLAYVALQIATSTLLSYVLAIIAAFIVSPINNKAGIHHAIN